MPQELVGPVEAVAEVTVPVVTLVQVRSGLTATDNAPAQLSLAGGGGGVPTQMVKLAAVPTTVEVVYTLTR